MGKKAVWRLARALRKESREAAQKHHTCVFVPPPRWEMLRLALAARPLAAATARRSVHASAAPRLAAAAAASGGHGHDHHHEDDDVDPPMEKTKDGAFIVYNTAFSLEWILTSPPPLHCFLEPPIMVKWPEGEDGHGHGH